MQSLLYSFPTLFYIGIFLVSFFISVIIIPSIIHVAQKRHLYDDLGHFRKQHDHGIPRLGGVAIFVSFTISSLMFGMIDKSLPINYLLTSCIILFAMGLKNDLSGVNSNTKFVIQIVAASIVVLLGNIRIDNLFGAFGVHEIGYLLSSLLSIILLVLIVNAFNLIDGIDGLAATTGIIVNGTFGILFICMHQYQLSAVSLCMVGAILGFLKFNLSPAKIFMGDTGAMLIGFISGIMAFKFMELNKLTTDSNFIFHSSPLIALAILIGPIFDTFRVFVIRIYSGISPFTADRNHLHHRLLALGLNHIQSTLIISICNLICILLVLLFQNYSAYFLITVIVLIPIFINLIVALTIRLRSRSNTAFEKLLYKQMD